MSRRFQQGTKGATRTSRRSWPSPVAIPVVTILLGCSKAAPDETSARLDAVERKIGQAQAKLAAVQKEVADAEARAEAARAEAEFQTCRAQVKEVRAEVERRRAVCAKDVADRSLCLARNSERTATTGIIGCGVGLVVAFASAGSAAPWALGGCAAGLGAGALSGDKCPAATCATTLDSTEADVLRERGLAAMPHCGGYAGLVLAARDAVAEHGLTVETVKPGTYADSANVAAGDVLIEVGGIPVGQIEDIDTALGLTKEGQLLHVSVIRGGELYQLKARASRRVGDGDMADSLRLGVKIGDPVSHVPYHRGVVVQSVAPASPTADAGIREGDELERVEAGGTEKQASRTKEVRRAADAEVFLEDVRASTPVTFRLVRGGRAVDARVVLGPRTNGTTL